MSIRCTLLDSITKIRIQKPNQKSKGEHFLRRQLTILAVKYFCKKSSIVDIQLGSKQALGNNI